VEHEGALHRRWKEGKRGGGRVESSHPLWAVGWDWGEAKPTIDASPGVGFLAWGRVGNRICAKGCAKPEQGCGRQLSPPPPPYP
jgi:hypothetical protein